MIRSTAANRASRAPGSRLELALAAHKKFLEGAKGGRQLVLDEVRLKPHIFDGLDLRDCRMLGAHLVASSFDGADLSFSNLFGCDFRAARFSVSNLTRCDLRGAKFDRAMLEGCVLRFADLRDGFVVVRGSDGVMNVVPSKKAGFGGLNDLNPAASAKPGLAQQFHYLVEGRTSLRYSDLRRADLCGANLACADLTGAILEGANLTDANLQGCDLSGASLHGAVIDNTNLSDADLTACDFGADQLAGANCPGVRRSAALDRDAGRLEKLFRSHKTWLDSGGAEGTPFYFTGRDFSGRTWQNKFFSVGRGARARFAAAKLIDCQLVLADLNHAVLAESYCRNTDFRGANLSGAVLRGAHFEDCRFDTAVLDRAAGRSMPVRFANGNLGGAVFDRCTLRKANFTGARLHRAVFRHCRLANATFAHADMKDTDFIDCELDGVSLDAARIRPGPIAAGQSRTELRSQTAV